MAMPTAVDTPELASYVSPTVTLPVEVDNALPTSTALPLPTVTPIYVEIKDGDTLLGIANRYGITLDALLAANPGLDPQFLWVGTVIEVLHVDEDGEVVGLPPATPVPLPVSAQGLSTQILPLWASIILLTIYSPRPVPSLVPTLVARKNSSNRRGKSSSGMPIPSSITSTFICSFVTLMRKVTLVLLSLYFIALLKRLENTC